MPWKLSDQAASLIIYSYSHYEYSHITQLTCACLRSLHFIKGKCATAGGKLVLRSMPWKLSGQAASCGGIPIRPVDVYRRFSAKLLGGQVNCLNWIDGALWWMESQVFWVIHITWASLWSWDGVDWHYQPGLNVALPICLILHICHPVCNSSHGMKF